MYIQTWKLSQPSSIRAPARISTTKMIVACSLFAACLLGIYGLVNFFTGDPATVADALQRWAEAVTG